MALSAAEYSEAFTNLVSEFHNGALTLDGFREAHTLLWSEVTQEPATIPQVGLQVSAVLGQWNHNQVQMSAWMAGDPDFVSEDPEQPEPGWYPLTNHLGVRRWLPSPKKLIQDFSGIGLRGSLDDLADLPPAGEKLGEMWLIEGDGYIWDGTSWENVGAIRGPQGPAATIAVDDVETLAPGSAATAENVGTPGAALIKFGIPAGVPGTAATVQAGTVTTLAPNLPATVENAGTAQARVLNFAIPRGVKGDKGDAFSVDAVGLLSERGAYDGEPANFSFLATDTAEIFFRLSGGGWSTGAPFGKGEDGASAYEVAVANGFAGTEAEWLASLEGEDGASAYEVALANGFVGTEQEWLASLEGADGADGADGVADPLEAARLRRDGGRALVALSKVAGQAVSLPDGRVDHFVNTNGLDLINSTGEQFYGAGHYISNTAPDPSQVPTLTGPSGGYVASASQGSPYNAFNNNLFDGWAVNPWNGVSAWLKLTLPSAQTAASYTVRTDVLGDPSGTPSAWTFEGSNDDATWDVLDTRSGETWTESDEVRTFVISAPTAYKHYRIVVTAVAYVGSTPYTPTAFVIIEMDLQLVGAKSAMSLRPTPQLAVDQPDYASLTVFARAGSGAITPDTDLTAFMSRDGGTTWTAAPLTAWDTFDGWTAYEASGVDISAQPAGQTMLWRLDATAAKDVRIDAVWFRWHEAIPNPLASPIPGWTVVGMLADAADLPITAAPGEVYLVGAGAPFDQWVFVEGAWVNLGDGRGPPGADGAPGQDGADGEDGAPGATDYNDLTNKPDLGEAAALNRATGPQIAGGTADNLVVTPAGQSAAVDPETLAWASTVAPSFSTRAIRKVTLGGNTTFSAPSGMLTGQVYQLWVYQDGTGSRTGAWNPAYRWGDAPTPTLSTGAGKLDIVTLVCLDAGTQACAASIAKGF